MCVGGDRTSPFFRNGCHGESPEGYILEQLPKTLLAQRAEPRDSKLWGHFARGFVGSRRTHGWEVGTGGAVCAAGGEDYQMKRPS